jgi:hypothetical protein
MAFAGACDGWAATAVVDTGVRIGCCDIAMRLSVVLAGVGAGGVLAA